MTTYTENFAGMTTGINPTNFTNRFASETGMSVETGPADGSAESDRVLRTDGSDTGIQLFSFDDVDGDANRDNCEMLCRFQAETDELNSWSIWGRASGSSGSEEGYILHVNPAGTLRFGRYNSGTLVALGNAYDLDFPADNPISQLWLWTSDRAPGFSSQPIDMWLWMRMRINGTGADVDLKCKIWADGQPEPDLWTIETTDSTGSRITAAGFCGWGRSVHTGDNYDLDYFSVATNGDTAVIALSADLAEIRLTQTQLSAAVQEADPILRLTQTQLSAAVSLANPEMRMTGSYVQVVYNYSVPPTPQTPDLMVPT